MEYNLLSNKLNGQIICPNCKSPLITHEKEYILCNKCQKKYLTKEGKYIFYEMIVNEINDPVDRIKNYFKNHQKLYNYMIFLISPIYCDYGYFKSFKKKYIDEQKVILNLGSGNTRLTETIINVDIFNYHEVDLVCNIEELPFKDNSVDVIINIAVLEHVSSPEKIVTEIYRVLKKGGVVYSFFPFIQGFHASPFDFQRRTIEGLKFLYNKFETEELRVSGGPTSGFLWVFQEWIALLLSFGIKPLYFIIHFLVMILTFPIKFLDAILSKHPFAKNISSGFIFVGIKR